MADEALPKTIYDVPTPALLVDVDKVRGNCARMTERCQALGVELRPHQKTHKTIEGGDLMTNGTRRKIVVSTLEEADFYASNGFDDILYAYPITASKLSRCKEILKKCSVFHLMVDNMAALKSLQNDAPPSGKAWSVFLEIDIGGNRTGINWEDHKLILLLARTAVDMANVDLQGVYSHDGNSYQCGTEQALKEWGQTASERIIATKKLLTDNNIECRGYGIGSTPTCSVPDESLRYVTEFHPGNYIFYDFMQSQIASCDVKDIACRVATRIVSHKPEQNRMYIDCGFLGITHDGLHRAPDDAGIALFEGHTDLKFIGMTQELGFVSTKDGSPLDYGKYPIDSMLFIYPWHSCATAACYTKYHVHSGDKITGVWRPTRGW